LVFLKSKVRENSLSQKFLKNTGFTESKEGDLLPGHGTLVVAFNSNDKANSLITSGLL
jgi:hypothetical protein